MAKHGHIHTKFNARSKGTILLIHKGYPQVAGWQLVHLRAWTWLGK